MHIRRLGVLLTEVAIGSPIFELAFRKPEKQVEIDFEPTESETDAAQLKDILRRVSRESSEDFVDAVNYCLQQGIAPRDVDRSDLESFYDNVVAP